MVFLVPMVSEAEVVAGSREAIDPSLVSCMSCSLFIVVVECTGTVISEDKKVLENTSGHIYGSLKTSWLNSFSSILNLILMPGMKVLTAAIGIVTSNILHNDGATTQPFIYVDTLLIQ